MVRKLLVGVDDSAGARAALGWADRFLDRLDEKGADCTAAMITSWSRPTFDAVAAYDDEFFRSAANKTLATLAGELRNGDRYRQVVRFGYPTFAVLNEADEQDVDLIVIGSRGRSAIAQVILGSVSRGVAAKSTRPVAIIPRTATEDAGSTTVVGYDDSPGARTALRWALDNLDGQITAVSAWTMPTPAVYDPTDPDMVQFRESTEQAMLAGLKEVCGGSIDERITPVIDHEDPRIALLDSDLDAASIVIGARAQHGFKGVLLGSTVNYVASHASVPVFVIPPSEDTAADHDR